VLSAGRIALLNARQSVQNYMAGFKRVSTRSLAACDAFSTSVALYARGTLSQIHVVTITFSDRAAAEFEAAWELYTQTYEAMYATCRRFVLVFDLRYMSIPPIPFILKKIALIKSVKWRTAYQVRFVCVLVKSDFIANVVEQLLAANRQAAPVIITTDTRRLAAQVAQAMYASDGIHAVDPRATPTPPVATLASVGVHALQIAIVVTSSRFICHFLALHAKHCRK
jgi:hypothetical protein